MSRMKRRILDSERSAPCGKSNVPPAEGRLDQDLRQCKEQPRPNLVLHRVPRPVPVPQPVPVPRADQREGPDGVARDQHRQGRDEPAPGLPAQARDLYQVDKDQVDELERARGAFVSMRLCSVGEPCSRVC